MDEIPGGGVIEPGGTSSGVGGHSTGGLGVLDFVEEGPSSK